MKTNIKLGGLRIMIFIILTIALLALLFNNKGLFYRESRDFSSLNSSNILEGAEPFEYLGGNKKAILFIHGFPGSPRMYYMVKELAIRDGYDVFIPKLPGFGTTHSDFIKSNFSMWYSYLSNYYNGIRGGYDKFYIAGNSMGGALTLKLAQNVDLKPTAIASIAAPVFLNSLKRGVLKSTTLYFIRYLSKFVKYIPPKNPPKDPSEDQDGDTRWVGYRGKFPRQIYSLYIGLKSVKKDLGKIEIPCYLCHAKHDKTVSYKNLNLIKDRVSSKSILIRVLDLSEWSHTNHSMFIYKSIVDDLWSDIDYFFNNL
ncbi:alpha/beta fold hydrolase [Thiospirochaeta perfilievii]|uniref:Alpha/beta fold hydrolase n=1 Tax=Thiospirochaeta perfilievii TaxID=252967 RepID=A0A5C1QBE0_9SPIO|nr:alpha/beta fold hydrolase [Thiospirochaeta perfilievii]QEN05375.1 alpha/beta fold hydrolase [Thiospirochaeta perfilievii]